MTVYVLVGRTHYEGGTVLGVYQSHEDAEAAYDQYVIDHWAYDGHSVHQIELGAPADLHW